MRSRLNQTMVSALPAFGLMLLIILTPPRASAQDTAGPTIQISAGFDGACKWQRWMPVRVRIENPGSDVDAQIVARISGPNGEARYAQSVSLPNGSRKVVNFPVYNLSVFHALEVELLSSGKRLATETVSISCLSERDRLYGLIAAEPSTYGLLRSFNPGSSRTELALLQIADIPENSASLEALDALIIAGEDTGSLTSNQRSALEGWVQRGGQLIVVGGPTWQAAAAGLGSMLPIEPDGLHSLQNLEALSGFDPAGGRLDGPVILTVGQLRPDSQVLYEQEGVPLVAARAWGEGSVSFLAADPSLEPLRGWPGLQGLMTHMLGQRPKPGGWQVQIQDWLVAAAAARLFPDIRTLSVPMICAFLLLYVLAIGPLNYLVLRKWKRRELAWVTVPGLVILFSGLSVAVGAWSRGDRPVIQRLLVVRATAGEPVAAVEGMVAAFSPHRRSYEMRVRGNYVGHPLPGSGGLVSDSMTFQQLPEGFDVHDLRMDVGDVVALGIRGNAPAPAFEDSLTMEVSAQGIDLEGEIRNLSSLQLEDAYIISDLGTHAIGGLSPGEVRRLGFSQAFTPPQTPPRYPVECPHYAGLQMNLVSPSNEETYRRQTFVRSLTPDTSSQATCPTGTYLVGWSKDPILEAELDGRNARRHDLALLVIGLTPQVSMADTSFHLNTTIMRSELLEASGLSGRNLGFDAQLGQGYFSLRFYPILPIPIRRIDSLFVYVDEADMASFLSFSLWDYDQSRWVLQESIRTGDNPVSDPERFVGPGGEVRLRVENPEGMRQVHIGRLNIHIWAQTEQNGL